MSAPLLSVDTLDAGNMGRARLATPLGSLWFVWRPWGPPAFAAYARWGRAAGVSVGPVSVHATLGEWRPGGLRG